MRIAAKPLGCSAGAHVRMVDKERLFDHCFERDIMAKEMEAVVVAYCGYFGFPDTEKEALVGLVEALKKVRQMEPSLMIRIAIS